MLEWCSVILAFASLLSHAMLACQLMPTIIVDKLIGHVYDFILCARMQVGDVVEKRDVVLGGPILLALAGPANRQGRMAADAIFGADVKFRGVQGTSVCGLFDLTVSMSSISHRVVFESCCFLQA